MPLWAEFVALAAGTALVVGIASPAILIRESSRRTPVPLKRDGRMHHRDERVYWPRYGCITSPANCSRFSSCSVVDPKGSEVKPGHELVHAGGLVGGDHLEELVGRTGER